MLISSGILRGGAGAAAPDGGSAQYLGRNGDTVRGIEGTRRHGERARKAMDVETFRDL